MGAGPDANFEPSHPIRAQSTVAVGIVSCYLFSHPQTAMKTRFLPGWLALCAAGTVLAADPAAPKAIVNFDNWQKFTDIKDQYSPTDKGEQEILDQLKKAIIFD